jgi:antitoxin MazE
MTVQTKAQKWGGSVSAPIPAAIARKLKITAGSTIEVQERNGSVVVTPLRRRRRTLNDILRSCKKKFPKGNPHGEFDYGAPVGKEVW